MSCSFKKLELLEFARGNDLAFRQQGSPKPAVGHWQGDGD